MSYRILEDTSATTAMLNGLKNALASDLREQLQPIALAAVDQVVKNLVARFEVHLQSQENHLKWQKEVNLTWLLKKEAAE